jgi:hypothetical protein
MDATLINLVSSGTLWYFRNPNLCYCVLKLKIIFIYFNLLLICPAVKKSASYQTVNDHIIPTGHCKFWELFLYANCLDKICTVLITDKSCKVNCVIPTSLNKVYETYSSNNWMKFQCYYLSKWSEVDSPIYVSVFLWFLDPLLLW